MLIYLSLSASVLTSFILACFIILPVCVCVCEKDDPFPCVCVCVRVFVFVCAGLTFLNTFFCFPFPSSEVRYPFPLHTVPKKQNKLSDLKSNNIFLFVHSSPKKGQDNAPKGQETRGD